MALVSILLSVVALLCTAVGFFTTPIPVVGTLFSFGAAATAIVGIVLGGRAITAAKQLGRPSDTGRIGVVLNALALVPALLVALTCGVCNALFSSGNVQLQRDFQFNVGQGWAPDAGPNALPPPQRLPGSAPEGEPNEPNAPNKPGSSPSAPQDPSAPPQQPSDQPGANPAPANNMPPPPLPAGPGR
jgi:hypothetical protein